MDRNFKTKILTFALIGILMFLMQRPNLHVAAETTNEIRISGLVNRPLNFTYTDLLTLPMVSEVATLECVFGHPKVTFNWTGVPLFHLLTLAQVKPEAREVVFRAPDKFSSSITIEEALKPTVILALKANGTLLSEVSRIAGIEGGFRIAVPCKLGYKWVTNVKEIEVVDYDYKGTYESQGFSDEADIPECVPPSITPALQAFNLSFGIRNFKVELFTNVSITAFNFNYLQKEVDLNVSVPSGTTGFANLILQHAFLKGPYSVLLDETTTDAIEANVTNLSFLYLAFPKGSHSVKIVGMEFFGRTPEIRVEFNHTAYVGEIVTFDASKSIDDGQIVSYEWDFGDGTNGSGAIVYHSYSKDGIYQFTINVTDNDGLSNFEILIVTAKRPPSIHVTLIAFMAATLSSLFLLFIIILAKRKPKATTKDSTISHAKPINGQTFTI